jgi:hypothetical protein
MKKTTYITLVFASLLSMTLIPYPTSANRLKPRTQFLLEKFYADPTSAWGAFEAGEVDIYAFGMTLDQVDAARLDPEIILAPITEAGMFEFDINNNFTILDAPDYRSPTSYKDFRIAMAHLVDKTYIVETILGGLGVAIEVPLAPHVSAFFDPTDLIEAGLYPYEYDPALASAILNDTGFLPGTTDNPYYDPTHPGSVAKIRTYPDGHEKAGQDLHPLKFYARVDSPPRFEAAQLLRDELQMAGIPVNFIPATFSEVFAPVFAQKNYHIYTGGWGLGRFPTSIYFLYHSDWWVPGVPYPNYVTGKFGNGTPVHPEYDTYLEPIWFAESPLGIIPYVQEAMEYHFNNSITIPLWSFKSYWAYREPLIGVVNMDAFGIENGYTFLNVLKPIYDEYGNLIGFDDTVKMGLVTPPVKLNPLYTSDFYGFQVLSYLYSGLFSIKPLEIYRDQPWINQDWWIGEWFDEEAGVTKTKLTYWFRKDRYFSDGSHFNATHYLFSMWYTYAYDDAWQWDAAMDIHHIELKDLNGDGWLEAEVYMNDKSIWFLYSPTFPILPKHVWLQDVADWPLATKVTETVPVNTTTGVVELTGEPVWVESVDELEIFTDWNLFLAPNIPAVLKILTPSLPSTVTVTYWQAGDASGYTPGDLPATDILIGPGLYKLNSLTPGAGGSALLERNPMRTEEIPLGEVDWHWYWDPLARPPPEIDPNPRGGYYRVDDLDVSIIWATMDLRGDGEPDGHLPSEVWPAIWRTQADISDQFESLGWVDLSDPTPTMANRYVEFGHPPA